MSTPDDALMERLCKIATGVYLTCEEPVADDIANGIRKAVLRMQELRTALAAKQDRPPRERFEHYKGGIYDVICVAFTEDKHEEVVVYQGADGRRWVRPYVEFAKNFKRVPA